VSSVVTSPDSGILTVTLNRPAFLNAFDAVLPGTLTCGGEVRRKARRCANPGRPADDLVSEIQPLEPLHFQRIGTMAQRPSTAMCSNAGGGLTGQARGCGIPFLRLLTDRLSTARSAPMSADCIVARPERDEVAEWRLVAACYGAADSVAAVESRGGRYDA
jgi:hypothetical protein